MHIHKLAVIAVPWAKLGRHLCVFLDNFVYFEISDDLAVASIV